MHTNPSVARTARRRFMAAIGSALPMFVAGPRIVHAQDKTGFPDGYDAPQAAPKSHKVIFENTLVRLLEVTVPPSGVTEPMHHHRWPSFFLSWDTGGKTPHVRYHAGDGSIRDEPSRERPIHPGVWHVQWMKPEPMHSIEVVENPRNAGNSQSPPLLRVEIKCGQ